MGKVLDLARKRRDDFVTESHSSKKSNSNLLYYLVIFVLLIIFIYSFNSFSAPTKKSNSPTSTPSNSELPDKNYAANTTQSSGLPQPSSTTSVTDQANAQVLGEQSIDSQKSKLGIKILNGSGKDGQAQEAKALLENSGYAVSEIGTAKNIYKTTVIYYKKGDSEIADLLAKTLNSYKVKTIEDSQIVENFDLLIVIGKS